MRASPILVLCFAAALAAGCGREADTNRPAEAEGQAAEAESGQRSSVAEALAEAPDHSEFLQALQSAGLVETMRGIGPYTVFAPTNAAFEALPQDTRRGLFTPEQREQLIILLSYHIVPGTVTAQDIGRAIERAPGGRAELGTVTGENLSLVREEEATLIVDAAGGRARVTRPDQIRSNGVIHSIDAVLLPGR